MARKRAVEKEKTNHSLDKMLWDIDDLIRETTFGKTWLEENLLCDPRIRQYQRQPHERGKRVWPVAEVKPVIKNIIMNEWI